jgi:hypothetical protein
MCRRSSPYNIFLRHFGINTTWYLHSHLLWLRFSISSIACSLSCAWRLTFGSLCDGLQTVAVSAIDPIGPVACPLVPAAGNSPVSQLRLGTWAPRQHTGARVSSKALRLYRRRMLSVLESERIREFVSPLLFLEREFRRLGHPRLQRILARQNSLEKLP